MHRILHTSDWHIGRRLKDHDRTREFREFFLWLANTIEREKIDTLLVAGDIFDNTTPSVQSQDMYYSFLSTAAKSSCRHIVIISGNHDSPAFLDAPAKILALNDIHVIGQARENPADEVIPLCGSDGQPELVVCAVPYLRDRDVRTARRTENFSEIERALRAGIMSHYAEVFGAAKDYGVPVVAMGHMFLEKGVTMQDGGERSLYVGTAVKLGTDIFPEWVSYTALGHLHSPQAVGRKNIRYSGSPIPMTFGEAEGAKSVSIVELEGENLAEVREIPVPVFQTLKHIEGKTMHELAAKIDAFGSMKESVWLDVSYTGTEAASNLQERVMDCAGRYPLLEVLGVHDEANLPEHTGGGEFSGRRLDDIEPEKMFELLMDSKVIAPDEREEFRIMYREILLMAEAEVSSK